MIDRKKYEANLELLKTNQLNTVCIEANCPNRYECFSNNTATFLILGDKCTRNCKYCNIESSSVQKEVDLNEVNRIVDVVRELGLEYVVITSVTRDDLEDFGSIQFVRAINALKENNCKVEVLVPDFCGDESALSDVFMAKPDVFNHNIEVVRELFSELRPEGDYDLSLEVLKSASLEGLTVKSGLMLGFGETMEQIESCLKDLKDSGVVFLTIGQYLAPSEKHFPVKKNYSDKEFKEIKEKALKLGFKKVECNKLVRSSYHAKEMAESRI